MRYSTEGSTSLLSFASSRRRHRCEVIRTYPTMRTLGFVVIVCALARTTMACPATCVCKWKGGKQTVECTNRDLIMLPDGMDPGTQVLEFSGNNLQTIQRERFQKMELINLQRIYLSRCRISSIDDRAFKGLSNLVELDFAENLLTSVPTESFSDFPSLMRLILNANPISVIHRAAFRHLSYLTTLELSNCEIEKVEDEAFVGLDSLEWLKLDGNKLTTIRGSHILPESLHGIDLNGNNWQCDCKMLDLHAWISGFANIPHAVEPTCSGPPRLAGKPVRSVEVADFACLPDVSPTTLYLEIGEGKNVSLLCKVSAVPEAQVSWWFQGQVLQNDTVIAPGLHLYYYIEEGTEDKKSELFIYNTNTEDNGTFVCVAENSAGKTQSNFTIRIIVKEEPIVIIVSFPFEYLLAITAAAGVLILILVISMTVSIIKCRRNRRRRKKKERSKEVLQHQSTSSKCPVAREDVENPVEPVKTNGASVITERQEVIFFATTADEVINTTPTIACPSQFRSPPSTSRVYSAEQNPDLINDTESVKGRRRDGDGGDDKEGLDVALEEYDENAGPPPVRQVQWQDLQFPVRVNSRELYQHTADVHLNPGCLLDGEGFPVDYGLPKVVIRPQMSNDHFYRTLPHNRANKRISAANPLSRFSREAEFLNRTAQPASYEHYCSQDVRYTVDGYPRAPPPFTKNPSGNYSENNFIPSPPEAYKTDSPSSLPCCGTPPRNPDTPGSNAGSVQGQWPPCLPAGLHMPSHDANQSRFATITKRCVGAQTDNGDNSEQAFTQASSSSQHPREILTESPDEGYVGESAEAQEM